jgi:type IV secretion system protein VirB10
MSWFRPRILDRSEPLAGEPRGSETVLERDTAIVAGQRSLQSRVNQTLALVLFGGLGVGMLTWYYAHALARSGSAKREAEFKAQSRAEGDTTLPPLSWPAPRAPRVSTAPVPSKAPTTESTSVLGPAPTGFLSTSASTGARSQSSSTRPTRSASGGQHMKSPSDSRREFSGAVFTRPTAAVPGAADRIALATAGATAANARGGSPLDARLVTTTRATTFASMLPTQRLLLPKGSFLDCTLETAIDSTLPGLTTCMTAVDTFSADGRVVLMERGTQLIGETQGDASQGVSRLFVLWTEARTPSGVIVPLDSPGTDELGRSGLAGQTRRHFWERFGAAILVSVIDGAVQTGFSGRDGAVVFNPSSTRDVGTEVLKSTVNIPPTITKSHGDRIEILVARDLDFRSVYALQPR